MLIFALVMLILLVAPLVFGKLRIPGTVGFIRAARIAHSAGIPDCQPPRLTKKLAVTMTMGGTIVTDMLALLLLAVVTRSMEGDQRIVFWISFDAFIALFLAGRDQRAPADGLAAGRARIKDELNLKTAAEMMQHAVPFPPRP